MVVIVARNRCLGVPIIFGPVTRRQQVAPRRVAPPRRRRDLSASVTVGVTIGPNITRTTKPTQYTSIRAQYPWPNENRGLIYPVRKVDKPANFKPIKTHQLLLPPTFFPTTSPPPSSCRVVPPPPPPRRVPAVALPSRDPPLPATPSFLTRIAPCARPATTPATSSPTPVDGSPPSYRRRPRPS
jgi:hypothetical protein